LVAADKSAAANSDAAAASTALRIILVAERLFSEQGRDGVSLRKISATAGQSNNFAVQYHFGSKEGLIHAILAHRLPRIETMRRELLDEALARDPKPDVRTLLDVIMQPLAVEVLDPTSRYVSFTAQFVQDQVAAIRVWQKSDLQYYGQVGVQAANLMIARLDHLPLPIRSARIRNISAACIASLANYERRQAQSPRSRRDAAAELPFNAFVTDLLDTTAAALLAPLSREARAALSITERSST
jgi:AcrR family transcriptional regulator